MAVSLSAHRDVGRDERDQPMPVAEWPPVLWDGDESVEVAVSGTAAHTEPVPAEARLVRVVVGDEPARLAVGVNAVAAATSPLFPAGHVEYVRVSPTPAGDPRPRVSAIEA